LDVALEVAVRPQTPFAATLMARLPLRTDQIPVNNDGRAAPSLHCGDESPKASATGRPVGNMPADRQRALLSAGDRSTAAPKPVVRPAEIAVALQQAVQFHHSGALDQAETLYRSVLEAQPGNFDAMHLLGVLRNQQGRNVEAHDLISAALKVNPRSASAFLNLGAVLCGLGRFGEAVASYDRAIRLKPDYAEAYSNRGAALFELKRLEAALASYDGAVAIRPDFVAAHNNRGLVLLDLMRPAAALASLDRAVSIRPDYANAWRNRGDALRALGRAAEALASYDRTLALAPGSAETYNCRGLALLDLRRSETALASFEEAIRIAPTYAEAFHNRAFAFKDLARYEEALASLDWAVAIKPDYAEAFNNRAFALRAVGRDEEALASLGAAIAIKPDYAEALSNRGHALRELARPQEALASCDRALAIRPDYAAAWNNRANALLDLQRPEEALASYEKALASKPDYAEAMNNRSVALHRLGRLEEALRGAEQALAANPGYAEGLNNRGFILRELGRSEEALASYERAIELKPDFEFLLGELIRTQMEICDWRDLDGRLAALVEKIGRGEAASSPHPVLGVVNSPALHRDVARIWVRAKHPRNARVPDMPKYPRGDKIRIGYFSADFHDHATAHLTAELFEAHDRSRFEVVAFSYGPDAKDEMRQRLRAAFDRFIDVRGLADVEVAKLARGLAIDIAVDLKGFTRDARTGVFADRAAPIQVNYLGYPGTMSADYIDYIIADRTLIPAGREDQYSENIAFLPNSYQVNDTRRRVADRTPSRGEVGLPEHGFVFCCFNGNYKITPGVFDAWMRILAAAPGSVLWLLEDNAAAAKNLRNEARRRGVEADRLVFAPRVPLPEHLARLRLADLFLDTLPCNAHTTASDALWVGAPVLTCLGDTFAGRVAASLLNAIGLPELVAPTLDAYEALANELAANAAKLASIKRKLADNRLTTPLFDTQLFARHIEAAYAAMYERYQSDLAPGPIDVSL
jgi:protein O-GlcNAc transferase